MATRELYEILLRIASESDPSAFADLKRLADLWRENGIAIEDINKGLAGIAERKYPDVFGKLEEQLRGVSDEGERAQGVLGGLLGFLRDVAAVAAGILIRDIIVGSIRKVGELAGALKDMAVDFVGGVKDVNAEMDFLRAQLTALLGGSQEAAQAIEYVRRMAIVTPLFGVAELAEAIRLLTAFGLNYERWMPIISATAAATGSSIQQMANAFGMIASGATTRGLYYLKIAGINVREAGIEFDKSGKAIGSTQEILEMLAAYLTERYGALMPEMARTWRGSIEAMRDMWYQFRWQLGLPSFEIVREKLAGFQTWLTENQDNILAFAYVLGEYPARALQRFLDFLGGVTGEIDFQAQDFFRGAVNLMVSFADGLLTALDSYVLPAILGIADLIASFLLGTSPPPLGPLSRVYEGAVAVMRTYLLALKEGIDFQTLNEIAGFIQSALSHVWAIEELPEEQLYDAIIRARMLVARAISEMRTLGGISPEIGGELAGLLGPIYQDVQNYLALLGQLQAATDAVTAAQERLRMAQERLAAVQAWVEEATKRVQEAQDRLRRFELETAEIPERFTRGRRRQLELAIQQAEEERRARQEATKAAQEQVRAAQEQVKAAQEQQRAVQEQISLQRAYLSELERIWKLQEQQAAAEKKAQEEGQQAFTDTKVALSDIGAKLDELKEKWRAWFAEEIDPILRRLEEHWTKLGDFIKGFLGVKVPGLEFGVGEISEGYGEGSRFRTAIDTIIENLDKIPTRMREILDDAKEIAIVAGGVWLVIQGIKLAEGLVWTAALAKALGITAAGAISVTTAGIAIAVILAIAGFAMMTATPEQKEAMSTAALAGVYGLVPQFDPEEAMGMFRILRAAIVDFFTGTETKDKIKGAAEEGIKEPLVDVAEDTRDALTTRSIFPDMIGEIIALFRELPWKLYPYLLSLYTTITVWIRLAATSWRLEMASMTTAVNNLARALEALIDALLRLRALLGGSTSGVTNMPRGLSQLHAGGPVLRTGQYQLEAGEYVINRERLALAGVSAGAGLLGGTLNFIHNWPEGIEKMKRRDFEKLAERAAFEAIKEISHRSGRD